MATAVAAAMQNALGRDGGYMPASTWRAVSRVASLCAQWILTAPLGSLKSSRLETRSTFLSLAAAWLLPAALDACTFTPHPPGQSGAAHT
jgi:hypothetical protein